MRCNYSTELGSVKTWVQLSNAKRLLVTSAREAADRSTSRYRLGAALSTSDRGVTLTGCNTLKTHPLQRRYTQRIAPEKITLHAEIAVLAKLRGVSHIRPRTMAIARVLPSTGELAGSRPCDQCLVAMMEFGVRDVLFYEDNNWSLASI